MYSFSYKNEIQRFILKRYSRIFSNSFSKNFFFNNANDYFIEHSYFKNPFNFDLFLKKNENLSILNNFFHKTTNSAFLLSKQLTSSTS